MCNLIDLPKLGTRGGKRRYLNLNKYLIIFIIFLFSINIKSFGASEYDWNGFKWEGDKIVDYEPPGQYPEGHDVYPNYYEIKNAGNLFWFAQHVGEISNEFDYLNKDASAVLMNDIEIISKKNNQEEYEILQELILSGNIKPSQKSKLEKFNWMPIGLRKGADYENIGYTNIGGYCGTFDGQGYSISGIYCYIEANSGEGYAGLFGQLGDGELLGTIKNVGVEHSYFHVEGNGSQSVGVGAICGVFQGGNIECCYSLDTRLETFHVTGHYIGGICGWLMSNEGNTIQNCYSAGLKLKAYVGVDPNSAVYLGGIVGSQETGKVQSCYSSVKQEDMVMIPAEAQNTSFFKEISGYVNIIGVGYSNNYFYDYDSRYWKLVDASNEKGTGSFTKKEVLDNLNGYIDENGLGYKFLNNPKAWAEGYNEFLVFKLDDPDLKIPVRVKINYDPSNKLETWVEKNLKHQLFRKTVNIDWEEMLENIHYGYDIEPVTNSIKINIDGSKTQDFIFNYYIVHLERDIDEVYQFGFNKKYPGNAYLKQDVGGGKKLFIDYNISGR